MPEFGVIFKNIPNKSQKFIAKVKSIVVVLHQNTCLALPVWVEGVEVLLNMVAPLSFGCSK
jgi:hypothetical protein